MPHNQTSSMDILDISSTQNRNMLVSFLAYILYMVAIISSATHFDMLFNQSSKIPLLGLEVDMSDFYTFAPLILLIFHFDVLYNTQQHLLKLKSKKEITNETSYPYIVNFAHLNGIGLKLFMFLAVFGFANFTFVYLLYKFSVIHMTNVYIWHIFLIILDFVSLFWIFKVNYMSYFGVVFMGLVILVGLNFKTQKLYIINSPMVSHKNIILKNLTHAELINFQGDRLIFKMQNLSHSKILHSSITNSRFESTNFSYSEIKDNTLSSNIYTVNTDFIESTIIDVDFSNSKFVGSSFKNATLINVDFSNSTLMNINFCSTKLKNIKRNKDTILINVKCLK